MGKLFYVPPGFDLKIAQEAAALVQNAYDQFNQGSTWKIKAGYDELDRLHAKPEGWLAKDEMFGFVARNQTSRDVFVTFRGTQSAEDWLSNLTFPQDKHPGGWGMVEKGFVQLYKQCSRTVTQAVASSGAARVFVTGHSLGGALATLATADLVLNKTEASMYSFASPRTGNRDFADRFDAAVRVRWRVANTEDLVTTVPLATVALDTTKANMLHTIAALASHLGQAFDFEHVGTPVNFTTHNGSLSGNHSMQTYTDALR
jgi:triacylglycerol lipase